MVFEMIFDHDNCTSTYSDCDHYNEDDLPSYTPMPWSLKEIRAAIPSRLFVRDTLRGLMYFARDILLAGIAWSLALKIDPLVASLNSDPALTLKGGSIEALRWALWGV